MSNKWFLALVALVIVGGGVFLFKSANKPLPGQAIAQLGRDHITDISEITYSSDPPTSGPHFPVWAKRGVYDRVISDGHLIHSMEHGYVVISYNCEKKVSEVPNVPKVSKVYAHDTGVPHEEPATDSGKPLTKMKVQVSGDMSFFTPQNPPEAEAQLPESFKSEDCKKMVEGLWSIGDSFQRVIVAPRPTLDVPIALTAWGRLLKLQSLDTAQVKDFISVYHNVGPEKTQE